MARPITIQQYKENKEKLEDFRKINTVLKVRANSLEKFTEVKTNKVLSKAAYLNRLSQFVIENYYEIKTLMDQVVSLYTSEGISRTLKKEWEKKLNGLLDEFEMLFEEEELEKTIDNSREIIDLVKNA